MKSKDCLELQAQLKEDQKRVDDLTEFIVRFERNFKGCEAIALRSVRELYIKKIKVAQADLDMMTQQDEALHLYICG